MLRIFATAFALVLVSQGAFGLGLGTLKQSSALNEPFDGRIEIVGANARDVADIVVKLADADQFARANVQRDAVLLALRFKVVDGIRGADYIQITSREAIREPFLNFLLELQWANGRVVREYTVLLDPPLYDPMRKRPIARAAPAAAPAPAPPAPMPAPKAVADKMTPLAQPKPTAVTPSADAGYNPGATLGTVQAHDTLWSIASRNLPDSSVSVQQMMLALLRTNPEAFGDGNINILKRGAILRLPPSSEFTALSRREAIAEVQRQHQLWTEYRGVATQSVAAAPLGTAPEPAMEDTPEPSTTAVEPALPAGEGHLELVAPTADDEQMGVGAGTEGDAAAILAQEELDAQVQENAELQARISEANEIIDLMRRQVDIKDDELAALQARLAELGIEAPDDIAARGSEEVEAMDDESVADDASAGVDEALVDEDHVVMVPEEPDVDLSIGEPEMSDDELMAEAGSDAEMPDEEIPAEMLDTGGGAEEEGGGLLGGLIPQHIANMVPGGAMTVLGVLAAIVIAIIIGLFKMIGGRSDEAEPVPSPIPRVADSDDDATATTAATVDDEEVTEAPADATIDDGEPFDSEDTTQVPGEFVETSPDLQRTIEATAEELAPQAPEEDPLEEVNVYLAYERFDQAEELVRKVIEDHPNEHKYQLRLLEVFYSSNDKAAYEEAARTLHDAVGESDPLWESAVAMWTEMSPERALFAEGAADESAVAASEPASGFVDITADDEDPSAKTMSMAPGDDSVLESTLVGLTPLADDVGDDASDDDGALDFDLGATPEDDGAVLDLTSAEEPPAAGDDDPLGVTTSTEEPAASDDDDMLDLTAALDDSGDAIFDISLADDDDEPDAESGVLDITDTANLAENSNLLDVTAPELGGGDHDLLDVTKTGDLTAGQSEDILNVTSPGLLSDDEPSPDPDATVGGLEDSAIDFDISDTVSPAFESEGVAAEPEPETDVFDITGPDTADADGDLDFDIGGLSDDDVTAEFTLDDDALDITGGLDDLTAATADTLGDGLGLNIPDDGPDDSLDTVEMLADTGASEGEFAADTLPLDASEDGADTADSVPSITAEEDDEIDFDLSLQSTELDELSIGGDTVGEPDGPGEIGDEESEIEFDLALQDTTEMDSLVIDDTLELPKGSDQDETLDDLAKSMEESMAELDLGDNQLGDDTGELDLSLADTTGGLDIDFGDADEEAPSLNFDIDDIDIAEMDHEDTVAMDLSDTEPKPSEQLDTVIMPPAGDDVEVQSDADEIDTKLNLAKAYIELGDNDGARSILDEVAREGSNTQQTEAQRLIDQLA